MNSTRTERSRATNEGKEMCKMKKVFVLYSINYDDVNPYRNFEGLCETMGGARKEGARLIWNARKNWNTIHIVIEDMEVRP